LSQLEQYADADLPRAVAALEQMLAALNRYIQTGVANAAPPTPVADPPRPPGTASGDQAT
jgi:hypothetical protein